MPRQSRTDLSPAQARYVVQRLIDSGAVRASTVQKLASEMAGEVARLERQLAMLRGFDVTESVAKRRRGRPAGSSSARPVSPEVAASRRIQGQYLGLIRQIPASRRGPFKKIAAEQSREKAIQALRRELAG